MHSSSVDYPCLTVCLPKCFLILRAGPDLNCFQATDAFLSRRNETLRMSRCALKMAAAPARPPACLPGGFTHQHGSWRVRMELDASTRGERINTCVNTHVQTHWQRYAETCIHAHTQFWIFHVQIIKERWFQTENMHCCWSWTNTWWRRKIYRAGEQETEQVSPPKRENPFRHTLFWNRAYWKAFPATRSHSNR